MCFLVVPLFELCFSGGMVSEEFGDGSEGVVSVDGEIMGGKSV